MTDEPRYDGGTDVIPSRVGPLGRAQDAFH